MQDYQRELLKKKYTVAEAEAENMEPDPSRANLLTPFGGSLKWEKLLSMIQPGDELWSYSTSEDSWKHRAGRAGFVLIRNDEFLFTMLTKMN
jgi:hypothetical protein